MGTTPRGIAYPDLSSPIENLRADLKELADTADAAIATVVAGEWQALDSFANGWTAYPGPIVQSPRILKSAGFTTIEGTLSGTGATDFGVVQIPPGFRPTGGQIRFAAEHTNTDSTVIAIDPDGWLYCAADLPVLIVSIACTFWSGL